VDKEEKEGEEDKQKHGEVTPPRNPPRRDRDVQEKKGFPNETYIMEEVQS
jgi:hypothetical protein